jgi:hypothetical protein
MLLLSFVVSQKLIDNIQPLPWAPGISNINFCLITNKFEVHVPLITAAFQSINNFLSPAPLYFNFKETDNQCDLFINITSNSNILHPGYCSRTPRIINNVLYYYGCNITINICSLQTAASFYNVLLHELLHVIGIDHPQPPVANSVISYAVTLDSNNFTVYDLNYITLQFYDVHLIDTLIRRDFPSTKINHTLAKIFIPLFPGYRHVSGLLTYSVNNRNDVEPCLLLLPLQKSPTSLPQPSQKPSQKPSQNPTTLQPSQQPTTLQPSQQPTTLQPSQQPTTLQPSQQPNTLQPSQQPTTPQPSQQPTTPQPSQQPTTPQPSQQPNTLQPSQQPTTPKPSQQPTTPQPSQQPTTLQPLQQPIILQPTKKPTWKTTHEPEEVIIKNIINPMIDIDASNYSQKRIKIENEINPVVSINRNFKLQLTQKPTRKPTKKPTKKPTWKPTWKPTHKPTPFRDNVTIKNRINPMIDIDTTTYSEKQIKIENEINPVVSINHNSKQTVDIYNKISPYIKISSG